MVTLLCPLCRAELTRGEGCFRCENGHSFDVARQGYVNLLPVAQKHSLHPGDTREMVAARRRFLQAGFYAPIAQTLGTLLRAHCPTADAILDVGCGEGYYLRQAATALPTAARFGMDISKDAVRYCAGQDKQGLYFVGTAAKLPFADGVFSALLSMFALTVEAEFARILKKNGIFVQVLAGEHHLPALKSIIYPQMIHKEKSLHPTLAGFTCVQSQELKFSFSLPTQQEVADLLYMTPHVWRIGKEGADRLRQTAALSDTAQVIFNVFRKE